MIDEGMVDLERFECIEGQLLPKSPKSFPHTRALALLMAWLRKSFDEFHVLQEPSIQLDFDGGSASEPEPDAVVLNKSLLQLSLTPSGRDIVLVVEVSSTTLAFDLTTKAALYAKAGIQDYWVLDVNKRRIIVHRNPQHGAYLDILAYSESESVSPLAAPQAHLKVADAF